MARSVDNTEAKQIMSRSGREAVIGTPSGVPGMLGRSLTRKEKSSLNLKVLDVFGSKGRHGFNWLAVEYVEVMLHIILWGDGFRSWRKVGGDHFGSSTALVNSEARICRVLYTTSVIDRTQITWLADSTDECPTTIQVALENVNVDEIFVVNPFVD